MLLPLLGLLVPLSLLSFSLLLLLGLHLQLVFLFSLVFLELLIHKILADLTSLLVQLLLQVDKVFHNFQVVLVLLAALTIVASADSTRAAFLAVTAISYILHLLIWMVIRLRVRQVLLDLINYLALCYSICIETLLIHPRYEALVALLSHE